MARQRLDADRLAAAYERDGRRLLIFFTRRTYDAQLAVDLVAETYARAFEQRRRFAADPSDRDALAWVFGIGRNVLHEALRRGRAERRALARPGAPGRRSAGARGRGADPHRRACRPGRAALGGPGRAGRARARATRGGAPARRRRARLSGRRRAPGRLRADRAGTGLAWVARAAAAVDRHELGPEGAT
ncbi:MAG TPA: sigma factor [Solirubrobacteraceae bacterium]|nr:sigma factor [Solirubrobacteraceae bacterium]